MSEPVRPVTVGTDGSPPADRAVEWAADEAAHRDVPLHIVHAVEPWPYDLPRHPGPGMGDPLVQAGHDVLAAADKLAASRQPGIAVTSELVQETGWLALRDRGEGALELVLGNRGHGGFASLLLGSTTLRLAGHATCPVIVIRGEKNPVHGEIVVGIDIYHDNPPVLRYAFDAARLRGAQVRVVHAFRLAENLIAAGDDTDMERLEEGLRRAMARTLGPWRERYPDVAVTEQIIRGHPVAALAEISSAADLVIIGAHGHGIAAGIIFGSVSHGVIHHAHCPVALVRPITDDHGDLQTRRP